MKKKHGVGGGTIDLFQLITFIMCAICYMILCWTILFPTGQNRPEVVKSTPAPTQSSTFEVGYYPEDNLHILPTPGQD